MQSIYFLIKTIFHVSDGCKLGLGFLNFVFLLLLILVFALFRQKSHTAAFNIWKWNLLQSKNFVYIWFLKLHLVIAKCQAVPSPSPNIFDLKMLFLMPLYKHYKHFGPQKQNKSPFQNRKLTLESEFSKFQVSFRDSEIFCGYFLTSVNF